MRPPSSRRPGNFSLKTTKDLPAGSPRRRDRGTAVIDCNVGGSCRPATNLNAWCEPPDPAFVLALSRDPFRSAEIASLLQRRPQLRKHVALRRGFYAFAHDGHPEFSRRGNEARHHANVRNGLETRALRNLEDARDASFESGASGGVSVGSAKSLA